MDLFYRKYGEGNPIIILHGLFGMSDNFATIGKRLSEKNFSVYIPDQRNHGNSPKSDEFNYEILSNDLNDFIETHALYKPIIIGHSMGGKVAMHYALKYPGKVRRLIIVDIGIKKYSEIIEITVDALLSVEIEKLQSRTEIEAVLMEKIKFKRVVKLMMKNVRHVNENNFDWKFNLSSIKSNFSRMHDSLKSKKKYCNPVLFIRGGLSDYIMNEDIPSISEIFPHGQFHTIANASHWVHADKPIDFLNAVSDFI